MCVRSGTIFDQYRRNGHTRSVANAANIPSAMFRCTARTIGQKWYASELDASTVSAELCTDISSKLSNSHIGRKWIHSEFAKFTATNSYGNASASIQYPPFEYVAYSHSNQCHRNVSIGCHFIGSSAGTAWTRSSNEFPSASSTTSTAATLQ